MQLQAPTQFSHKLKEVSMSHYTNTASARNEGLSAWEIELLTQASAVGVEDTHVKYVLDVEEKSHFGRANGRTREFVQRGRKAVRRWDHSCGRSRYDRMYYDKEWQLLNRRRDAKSVGIELAQAFESDAAAKVASPDIESWDEVDLPSHIVIDDTSEVRTWRVEDKPTFRPFDHDMRERSVSDYDLFFDDICLPVIARLDDYRRHADVMDFDPDDDRGEYDSTIHIADHDYDDEGDFGWYEDICALDLEIDMR